MRKTALFLSLGTLLAASRFCHIGILWEGDAYPLAAAGQWLQGRALYRALWFDKPPLLAAAYLVTGGRAGWPLRLWDAAFVLLVCWLFYRLAREWASEREGLWAATLAGFFLIFDLPSSVIPVASDLLMLAPHLAAIWLAIRRKPFACGVAAGVAFWINPKGAFVAAACVFWNPAGVVWMAAGFAAVSGAALAWLAATGALAPWWTEVWVWGRLYAASPPGENPLANGALRTLHWAGFHIALLIAAAHALRQRDYRWQWLAWLALAALGVCAGLRFFPRYYFLLMAPMVLLAARGFARMRLKPAAAIALLLLIPLARFAPTYRAALSNSTWNDTAMDRDSRSAAAALAKFAKPGDTLFVWGYRPELYVYTRLPAATMYLDAQPLTGVPADRHLTQSDPVDAAAAQSRRAALVRAKPTFIVDGLGPYNPHLAIGTYPDLAAWLARYHEVARTAGTVIYTHL